MSRYTHSLGLILGLALGCNRTEPEAESHHDEEHEHEHEDTVELIRPAERVIFEAAARVVSIAPARGEINVLHRALVVRLHVAAGDRVKRGQILIEAAMPEVSEAVATYRSAGARLELAEKRHAQIAPLQKEGLLRGAELYELEQSIHELRSQRARSRAVWQAVGLSEAELSAVERAGLIPLKAPVEGVVVRMEAELGHMAEPGGRALAEVQGEALGRVEASLGFSPPPGSLPVFDAIDGRSVTLSSSPAQSLLDPSSGRLTVWFKPEPEASLPSGLLGKLRLRPGQAKLLEAPSYAVDRDAEGTHVMLDRPAGPTRVAVRVLEDRTGRVVFVAPLAEGTRVRLRARAELPEHVH